MNYSELQIALEFEKVVRMFERAAIGNPELRNGLSAAAEMTKLWSMKFAPGDENHPFYNGGQTVAGVFERAKRGEILMGRPMPLGETERERNLRTGRTKIRST